MIDQKRVLVSTNKNKLDTGLIHEFLSKTYWAKGRTLEQVKKSIHNSICFGIYLNDEQVGFARVISDKTVFAYLLDVFIIEKYRGNGLSKILLKEILNSPDLNHVSDWLLATNDANKLYAQFGFVPLSKPELYMEK